MTSANVTHYWVSRKGKVEFKARQHCMCRLVYKDALMAEYVASGDGVLLAIHPDEEECSHYSKPMRLKSFANGAKIKW